MTITLARNDNDLRKDILFELEWDPKITSKDIALGVKEGVVTLSGFVPSFYEKLEAENAVKRIYGVRAVANDLEVQLKFKRTDPEIARDAVQALESHVSISADKIKLTVEKGWVTLEGTVDWKYQKNVADSVVRNLKGVVGIINKIDIKPRVSVSDVKTKIEDALRRSAELDARRITIEVDGSTVKLHGRVSSWGERDDAERAAWSAPGTAQVENEIDVTP